MTIPANLLLHLQEEVITIAYLWKIVRADAVTYGFTNVDKDLFVGGLNYKASTGFTETAIDKDSNLSVDNIDVAGPLGTINAEDITKTDLFTGRLKAAQLTITVQNYEDLAQTGYIIFSGEIGEVKDRGEQFEVEVISHTRKLQNIVGRLVMPLCDADFADARCGLALGSFTFSGTVRVVTSNSQFQDNVSANIINKADDFFGTGEINWLTGNNINLDADIKTFNATQVFVLNDAMPSTIQVGDTFNVVAGCRKRKTIDCITKFNNVVNHRGFTDIPGDKFLIKYASQ